MIIAVLFMVTMITMLNMLTSSNMLFFKVIMVSTSDQADSRLGQSESLTLNAPPHSHPIFVLSHENIYKSVTYLCIPLCRYFYT